MMDIRYQTIEPGSELMLRNWANARLLRFPSRHDSMLQDVRSPGEKKEEADITIHVEECRIEAGQIRGSDDPMLISE
jgi:hypothetical protein